MTLEELKKVSDGDCEKIMEVSSDVSDYLEFSDLKNLGLQVHHSELDFDKIMMFSWIKERLDSVRKN